MKYVIRLNREGYFGQSPYRPVLLKEAIIFDSMKEARKQLNILNSRLWTESKSSEIEVYNKYYNR